MKKLLGLILSASLVACGSGGGTGQPKDTQAPNTPPTIEAIEQGIESIESSKITIESTASDADSDQVSFKWKQVAGRAAEILVDDKAIAEITLPKVTLAEETVNLTFELTVTDSKGASSSKSTTVKVSAVSIRPSVVIAELAQSTDGLTTVSIDASASYDSDSDFLSYNWSQVSGPTVKVAGANESIMSFKSLNYDGEYRFKLVLTDEDGLTSESYAEVNGNSYYKKVSTAANGICTLSNDGVYCWGEMKDIKHVPELVNPTALELSTWGGCVIDEERVKCWPVFEHVKIPDVDNPISLYSGSATFCATSSSGPACWGQDPELPEEFKSSDVTEIAIGGYGYKCFNKSSKVSCIGRKFEYQELYDMYPNFVIPEMTSPSNLKAKDGTFCAEDSGYIKCWGTYTEDTIIAIPSDYTDYEIGGYNICTIGSRVACHELPGVEHKTIYSNIDHFKNPTSIDLSSSVDTLAGCVVDIRGVECFDYLYRGQLSPIPIENPRNLAAGYGNICVYSDSSLNCWGMMDRINDNIPTIQNTIQDVSVNDDLACVIDGEQVKCWGGKSSYNTFLEMEKPSFATPKQVSVGLEHACVVDDSITCWGGGGVINFSEAITNTPDLSTVSGITSGDLQTCALSNNKVHCWGTNYNDSWSSGENNARQPENLVNPTQVASEDVYHCALDDEGVKCWGDISYTIPELKNPSKIWVGPRNACALTEEGVKCWGESGMGQLEVPSLSNLQTIAIGRYFMCALDDDGIKCWGYKGYGESMISERQ